MERVRRNRNPKTRPSLHSLSFSHRSNPVACSISVDRSARGAGDAVKPRTAAGAARHATAAAGPAAKADASCVGRKGGVNRGVGTVVEQRGSAGAGEEWEKVAPARGVPPSDARSKTSAHGAENGARPPRGPAFPTPTPRATQAQPPCVERAGGGGRRGPVRGCTATGTFAAEGSLKRGAGRKERARGAPAAQRTLAGVSRRASEVARRAMAKWGGGGGRETHSPRGEERRTQHARVTERVATRSCLFFLAPPPSSSMSHTQRTAPTNKRRA